MSPLDPAMGAAVKCHKGSAAPHPPQCTRSPLCLASTFPPTGRGEQETKQHPAVKQHACQNMQPSGFQIRASKR